jgi:2-polyprenyl-3-methyl-5-hydroxy-6-metoxy-1,4-benzoquinol methylase
MIARQPDLEEITRTYNYLFENGEYERHRVEFQTIKSGKMPPNFYRRHLLKRIERMCSGRTLIEIGGGTGAFGVLATSLGWQYTNYDISAVAVTFCQELSLKANLFNPGALPSILPQSADVMVMWEVIEHIWNLYEYLQLVRETLKTKGIFLFSTPNYLAPPYHKSALWGLLASPPIHTNFFTKESLEKSLHMCGFIENKVFKRRIYRPEWSLSSLTKSLRAAFFLDEPETLYGIARKD